MSEEIKSDAVAVPEVEKRPRGRPPLNRDTMREDDSRSRAAKRLAEFREHNDNNDMEEEDRFHINPKIIPDGWSYEWKKKSVWGKEDPNYEVGVARRGWEAVPASRHPELMPAGNFSTIERDGMILMERPMELTEDARARDRQAARKQVKDKEEQLNDAPKGQFERNNKGDSLRKINKSYERMEIPEK